MTHVKRISLPSNEFVDLAHSPPQRLFGFECPFIVLHDVSAGIEFHRGSLEDLALNEVSLKRNDKRCKDRVSVNSVKYLLLHTKNNLNNSCHVMFKIRAAVLYCIALNCM